MSERARELLAAEYATERPEADWTGFIERDTDWKWEARAALRAISTARRQAIEECEKALDSFGGTMTWIHRERAKQAIRALDKEES